MSKRLALWNCVVRKELLDCLQRSKRVQLTVRPLWTLIGLEKNSVDWTTKTD